VRAIREATGDDMAIMVDYNQCLSPVEAVERLRILDDEGLTWVEEPTLAHDYAGHAFVAREARTPIQCGENWWGTLDMLHAVEAHASDFVMPDVMKIGGVTGWLRAATLAHSKGIRMSNHLWPSSPSPSGRATVFGVKFFFELDGIFLDGRSPLRIPCRSSSDHAVENDQELTHASRQDHLWLLPRSCQAPMEGSDGRITTDCRQGGHI
jgi:hypothetical protein